MRSHLSTLHSPLSTVFWLVVILVSLGVIAQVSSDYLGATGSLQNFFWRVESFAVEGTDKPTANLVLELQNRSRAVMRVRELELYVQANETDVGKTYPPLLARTVQSGEYAKLSLTIPLDANQVRFAQTKGNGPPTWRILGTYKITTPFADSDFFYHLRLPVE